MTAFKNMKRFFTQSYKIIYASTTKYMVFKNNKSMKIYNIGKENVWKPNKIYAIYFVTKKKIYQKRKQNIWNKKKINVIYFLFHEKKKENKWKNNKINVIYFHKNKKINENRKENKQRSLRK